MLAYLYIVKTRFLVSLAYRFEVITSFVVQIILLTASIYFWKAAYAHNVTVSHTTLPEMITYTLLATLISLFHSVSVEGNIVNSIRKGNVALDFVRPVSIMGVYFAQDVGNIVSNIFQKFIPVLLFASVVIGPPVPHSLWSLVMFIISMILGFLILWFISAIFGLLAFWLIDLGPIGGVKHYIVRFLSGSFIPLWFFPQGIADAMRFFPFMYIYQSPISIFLGKSSVLEAFLILFTQLIWVGILFLCCYSLQRKAFRNVVVQGG